MPGAITVLLYRYFMDREQENSTLVLYGVIISGLIKSIVDAVSKEHGGIVMCCIAGAVIAVFAYLFVKSSIAQTICGLLKVTPTSNHILSTIDMDGGTLLLVHLKSGDGNRIVCGHVALIDKNWIRLRDYSLDNPRDCENCETYSAGLLCIPMSEVAYYATAYDNDNTPIMNAVKYKKR